MRLRMLRSTLLATLCLSAACTQTPVAPIRMDLTQRAGQLFFGFIQSRVAAARGAAFDALVTDVRAGLGGAVISLGTVEQAAAAARVLDGEARFPLLFAADFEAGVGYRLEGGTRFPYALGLGATFVPDLARRAARVTAAEGKSLGIDWSLAPVADVNTNPRNPIINVRSFGEHADAVARFVAASVRGFAAGGMLCCLKHFPGHGDVAQDSHRVLPRVTGSAAHWRDVVAPPFIAGIGAGAPTVMTAHLAVPAFDDPRLPATMSPRIVAGLLRGALHFDGLVVTDALDMGAITRNRSPGRAAVDALKAGADVLLMSPDFGKARAAVVAAVESGELARARFDEAVGRVLDLKRKAGVLARRVRDRPQTPRRDRAPALAPAIARRAITLIRDRAGLLPIEDFGPRPFVLSVLDSEETERGGALVQALGALGHGATRIVLTPEASPAAIAAAIRRLQAASTLIVALHVRVREFSGKIGLPPALRPMLARLATHKRTVFCSLGNPYLLAEIPAAGTYVVAYDEGPTVERALARAVCGEATIDGRLPVTIPGQARYGDGLTIGGRDADLGPASPESEGFDAALRDRVARYVADAIERRVFPGCQIVVVRRNGVVVDGAYGHETYARGSAPITPATRYDLASVTKILATTGIAMALHSTGKLDLDRRIVELVPGFTGGGRERITFYELMTHSAGLPGWRPLFKTAHGRKAFVDAICQEALVYAPGRGVRYSDLGMILCGIALERQTGQTLDALARRLVFEPLGMHATSYGPLPATLAVAPTEVVASRGGVIRGRVHDENTEALGGIAGHAGLFSTARDVARFARVVLAGGRLGGQRVFAAPTIRLFTTRSTRVLETSRAIGWETWSADSSAGRKLSHDAIGHTGFTGTSLWLDKERDLAVVCLTNRVHPTRANKKIHAFRRGLHDLVVESLTVDPVAGRSSR